MTEKQIKQRQAAENAPYEIALKIRALLDEAKKSYTGDWDNDAVEERVSELVFEEA